VRAGLLKQDPLDLIQAGLIIAAVVELGGAGRGVIGNQSRLLQRAPVLEIGGDAGGAESVIANPGFMPAARARRWIMA
jgi:hypothetical protein